MAVDTSPLPDALQTHCADCIAARGRWHRAAGALQQLHGVLQPRLMTTVLALGLLLAGALWLA